MKDSKKYNTNQDQVISDAAKVYWEHVPKKGESWKFLPTMELDELLQRQFDKYNTCTSREDEYKELLNLINVASMLAARLKYSNPQNF